MSNELRKSNSFFDLLSDTGSMFQNRFFQEIKLDVHETEDNYQVTADLPGYAKEDITVDYDNDILSISAVRKSEKVEKDDKGQIIRQERSSGSVHREIYLKGINDEDITATLTEGVLNLVLPKKEPLLQLNAKLKYSDTYRKDRANRLLGLLGYFFCLKTKSFT